MYKLKLKPGDFVRISDLTDEQYHEVAKRFLDDGYKNYHRSYDPTKFNNCWLFFGLNYAGDIVHTDDLMSRVLTYDEIMEKAEPDLSQAPDDATHYYEYDDGNVRFFKKEVDLWFWRDKKIKMWVTVSNPANLREEKLTPISKEEIISNTNEWYDKGEVPPVGTECEMRRKDPLGQYWRAIRITAIGREYFLAETLDTESEGAYKIGRYDFRPIQSERDRTIEEAKKLTINLHIKIRNGILDRDEEFCILYDAGMLRLPEDK